jgi:hypothetical protein
MKPSLFNKSSQVKKFLPNFLMLLHLCRSKLISTRDYLERQWINGLVGPSKTVKSTSVLAARRLDGYLQTFSGRKYGLRFQPRVMFVVFLSLRPLTLSESPSRLHLFALKTECMLKTYP